MSDLLAFMEEPATRHDQLRECFEKFHAENPEVYELFCRFTDQLIQRGRTRYSADAVLHRVRWHVNIDTSHDCAENDTFKINDHHSAFYARMWLADHPGYPSFFRTREQPSTAKEGR